jgi:hypothetical protein
VIEIEKHFVTFCSPGTFVSEQSTKEIDSWDINKAVEMSKGIEERYKAVPYGFYFTTRSRHYDDLDSIETARSNMYYLGGEVFTLKQIKDRNNPEDKILISNMEDNGFHRVIINDNSWKWTAPLKDGDVVLDV